MANVAELTALIELEREDRFLEYKESKPWASLKDKIVKTAMGMANTRDGGTIIIGISERTGSPTPQGMSPADVATYKADDIQAYVNRFADPYVRLEVHSVKLNSKDFLAIIVFEFEEIPVVCQRDGRITRRGALYTRSYRMPETCEVQSQTEMREILEIATDKGIRRFLERSQRVGLPILNEQASEEAAGRADVDKFDQQLGGL